MCRKMFYKLWTIKGQTYTKANQYTVQILSPVNDNCLSCLSYQNTQLGPATVVLSNQFSILLTLKWVCHYHDYIFMFQPGFTSKLQGHRGRRQTDFLWHIFSSTNIIVLFCKGNVHTFMLFDIASGLFDIKWVHQFQIYQPGFTSNLQDHRGRRQTDFLWHIFSSKNIITLFCKGNVLIWFWLIL